MNIKEIPQVLFQEFSKKFGKGKQRKVSTCGRNYLLRELGIRKVGFPGAIGLREDPYHFVFVLWRNVPKGKDTVFEPEPVLTIMAGPENTGVWAYGSGRKMAEMCKVEFPLRGIDLESRAFSLIPSILQRASELANTAESEEFWEKERSPQFPYDKPPG